MTLAFRNVSHGFGETKVLAQLDFEVDRHEFVVIIGPSGCGKTTLLQLCAGYYAPLGGELVRTDRARMIHQDGGLFPWLTTRENIAMGLVDANGGDANRKITELVDLIALQGFEDHYPHQLSGGMRQRVELARALATEAELLLMDEPFSALDYQTRLKMRRELAAALAERPRTVVLVTHDIDEAVQLADRILVLSKRPSTIVAEHRLSIPRPRDPADPLLVQVIAQLLPELGLS